MLTEAERDAWGRFLAMRRQLDLYLERRLQADAGISVADFEVLSSLTRDPNGRIRAGALGELIGWEKSRLSHQLTRMERRGLVNRVECDSDHRGVWIEITDAGASAHSTAAVDHAAALREWVIDPLGSDDFGKLDQLSTRILDALDPPVCESERTDRKGDDA